MILEAYRPCSRSSRNWSWLPSNVLERPTNSSLVEALVRWSLMADRHRESTASAIRVTGMPRSRAFTAVHLPVPFWPALSRIFSTRGVPSSSLKYMMSLVISIRKESKTPLFHVAKTSPICLLVKPRPRFMMSYAWSRH